jgi:hypothetical protein
MRPGLPEGEVSSDRIRDDGPPPLAHVERRLHHRPAQLRRPSGDGVRVLDRDVAGPVRGDAGQFVDRGDVAPAERAVGVARRVGRLPTEQFAVEPLRRRGLRGHEVDPAERAQRIPVTRSHGGES